MGAPALAERAQVQLGLRFTGDGLAPRRARAASRDELPAQGLCASLAQPQVERCHSQERPVPPPRRQALLTTLRELLYTASRLEWQAPIGAAFRDGRRGLEVVAAAGATVLTCGTAVHCSHVAHRTSSHVHLLLSLYIHCAACTHTRPRDESRR